MIPALRRHPLLSTLGLCALVGAADLLLIDVVSGSSSSYSGRWLVLCGVLIILAALAGYRFFDGRKPAATADKVRYSAVSAVVCAATAWGNFWVTQTNWGVRGALAMVHQGGFSVSHSRTEETLTGLVVGFLVCFIGFRNLDDL